MYKSDTPLLGKKIVLAVTGSIAVYKTCQLLRDLNKLGAHVDVLMSQNATRFVTPLTFEALLKSGKVVTDLFSVQNHVELARDIDLLLIAPATANILGKCANGICDEDIATFFVSVQCPVLFVPAMHEQMWLHPAVQANVKKLRTFKNVYFEGPVKGDLASGDHGEGRMQDIGKLVDRCEWLLTPKSLEKRTILLSCGPTYEFIDSVRFISNLSSGKLGIELARAFYMRGAKVLVVSSLSQDFFVDGIEFFGVTSADDMYKMVHKLIVKADIFVANAAVADVKVKKGTKGLKKSGKLGKIDLLRSEFEPNKDILASLKQKKGTKIFVGFTVNSDFAKDTIEAKILSKNMDFCFAFDEKSFGSELAKGEIYDKNSRLGSFDCSKRQLAVDICDFLA